MLKRVLAALCVIMMIAALIPASLASVSENGISVWVMDQGDDTWSGANIILGSDASAWPFSTAEATETEGSAVAFTPEKDATYRLTYNVTSTGVAGFRVRWIKDNTNGSYTSEDGVVVNDHPFTADQVGDFVPAYFQNTIAAGETKTYTVEFKMDGAAQADGLIGNIAIRGQSGNNDFVINWVKVEKVDGGVLAEWDGVTETAAAEAAPAAVAEPAETAATPAPAAEATKNAKTGDEAPIAIAVVLLLTSACAAFIFNKKRNSDNA